MPGDAGLFYFGVRPMKNKIPSVVVQPMFRCYVSYDSHDKAGEFINDESDQKFPYLEWDELNNAVHVAASNAETSGQADINQFPGGAACFPYIEILAPTWAECKAMGDAVIRCIIDNGGTIDPKDSGINI